MDTNSYIRQLESENALLRERNATLEKRNAALEKRNAELEQRVAQLENHIAILEKHIADQEKHIADLERRLSMNSRNSSRPPSSDPPGAATLPPAKPKAKRGARQGHPPYLRSLLGPEAVTRRIEVSPKRCPCGSSDLERTAEEPLRHQVVDVPPIRPEVVEYVQSRYRCRKCGRVFHQPLPDEIKRRCFGPGLLAVVGTLTGMINTSKRRALSFINEVFRVPMSLGGLSACEAQIAEALAGPHREALSHVRRQPTANADETGWPRSNREKGWLWTFCCEGAAAFLVMASRGQAAARKLLGDFAGTLTSDRWSAYNCFGGKRQLCWAHLKRDFQALSEAGGAMGAIGRKLSALTKKFLHMHRRVRDGTLRRKTFQCRAAPLMPRVETLLSRGAAFDEAGSGQCRRVFNQRRHLWTFVQDERVEATNNLAERAVRQGVLWRKGSLGTQSERGARYVERILTACATCRLQGRSIIQYLRDACRSHIDGLDAPSLISNTCSLARIA
jgi:transposase